MRTRTTPLPDLPAGLRPPSRFARPSQAELTRRRRALAATVMGATLLLGACTTGNDPASNNGATSGGADAAKASTASQDGAATDAAYAGTILDAGTVHRIEVTFDDAAYDAAIATYRSSGAKEWIEATVTIDGTTYERVGLRLKGNSSLMGLRNTGGGGGRPGGGGAAPGGTVSADTPEALPWLIKLDKFVDKQDHDGLEELVIRSNRTSTSLNEAVALDLMDLAGLPSQQAIATTFAVNGSAAVLRLGVELPEEEWIETAFGTEGSLYKAESGGDYSYRGDDPAAYDEVFDLEAGDDENLEHLTDFLQFINESDDATFAAELDKHLDVETFATYLAMQELLNNFDDIDGPGNNSYLYYDPSTGKMTIVPWDMNLAFGAMGGGGGPGGGGPGGGGPGGAGAPPGGQAGGPPGGGGGRGMGRSNVLVQRFQANATFNAMYTEAKQRLQTELFDSGKAMEVLNTWTEVLGQTDAVSEATITTESQQISTAVS